MTSYSSNTVEQDLKSRREPGDTMMIRLEIPSGNSILAITWYKVHELEKKHHIKTSTKLREREKKFVKQGMFAHF